MEKAMKSIYNCETGETEIREFNQQELKQIAIDVKKDAAKILASENEVKAKIALLDRLGITEDEAKLLLG
jgi:hypothetical protein